MRTSKKRGRREWKGFGLLEQIEEEQRAKKEREMLSDDRILAQLRQIRRRRKSSHER